LETLRSELCVSWIKARGAEERSGTPAELVFVSAVRTMVLASALL
jgi:hypothetical protein